MIDLDAGDYGFEDVPEMAFRIYREHFAPGRTFSEEAVRAVHAKMGQFMMERISREWKASGEPPQEMVIRVRCDLGGKGEAMAKERTLVFTDKMIELADAVDQTMALRMRSGMVTKSEWQAFRKRLERDLADKVAEQEVLARRIAQAELGLATVKAEHRK